jgi:ABC-type glutathione transport system ATPase component
MKITIVGKTGEGKSAVAHAIKKVLNDAQIRCHIFGSEDERENVMEATWQNRLEALQGTCIEIETMRSVKTISMKEKKIEAGYRTRQQMKTTDLDFGSRLLNTLCHGCRYANFHRRPSRCVKHGFVVSWAGACDSKEPKHG